MEHRSAAKETRVGKAICGGYAWLGCDRWGGFFDHLHNDRMSIEGRDGGAAVDFTVCGFADNYIDRIQGVHITL